jgi:hypothetical protein
MRLWLRVLVSTLEVVAPGPGTNGGEVVTMLEHQSEYTVRVMNRMMRGGVTAVEATLGRALPPLAHGEANMNTVITKRGVRPAVAPCSTS